MDNIYSQTIKLYIPKYKFESDFDLVPYCKALGMKDCFDVSGKADFSGMGCPKGLIWISQIKHKAFIDVNEQGTEAAAATAVEMMLSSAAPSQYTPVFRADHPFLFLIHDNQTGAILFIGRIVDPGVI